VYNAQFVCKHVLHVGGPKAHFLTWWMMMQTVVCCLDKCLCQTLEETKQCPMTAFILLLCGCKFIMIHVKAVYPVHLR